MKNQQITSWKTRFPRPAKWDIIQKQTLRVVFLILFFITNNEFISAQTYRYKFQIEGVTDMASAKEITDPLRDLFNESSEPFRYFPTFDDERNEFDFKADMDVSKEVLVGLLADQAFILTTFVRYQLDGTLRLE